MSKKQEFVDYVRNALTYLDETNAPLAPMNEEAQSYWQALLEGVVKVEKPE